MWWEECKSLAKTMMKSSPNSKHQEEIVFDLRLFESWSMTRFERSLCVMTLQRLSLIESREVGDCCLGPVQLQLQWNSKYPNSHKLYHITIMNLFLLSRSFQPSEKKMKNIGAECYPVWNFWMVSEWVVNCWEPITSVRTLNGLFGSIVKSLATSNWA